MAINAAGENTDRKRRVLNLVRSDVAITDNNQHITPREIYVARKIYTLSVIKYDI